MNKTLNYALATVLGLGIVMSGAQAQNFPDVPDNHWAYEALENMKREGLLVGYPDGLYRGGRPATRYEMAVAIYATYTHLKGITDGLQAQITALGKGGAGYNDAELRAALEALKAQVDGMKGWGDSINDLKRMMSTFEKELAAMGVDIEAMKRDIANLNDRVTKLENNKLPVTIGGDVRLIMQHGKGTSGRFGLGTDGSLVGGTPDLAFNNRASGILDGLSVFHSATLVLKGTNETGPKWESALEIGNLLNGYGAAPGMTANGGQRNDEANTDIVFRRLMVEFDHGLIGQAVSFKVGRIGHKISKYMFQMPDTNPYVSSTYDDNGEYTMDGAVLGFNFGTAKLNVMLGRTSGRTSSGGVDVGGVFVGGGQSKFGLIGGNGLVGGLGGGIAGGIAADTTLGAHLNLPIGEKGGVNLAYLVHSQNTPAGGQDNVTVYGGDVDWDFNGIMFKGGYAQSRTRLGNNQVAGLNNNNSVWHAGLGYESERWGLSGGYREIGMNYGGAGDWGRIGAWWNPRDIKGWMAKGWFGLSDNTKLYASGQWVSGLGRVGGLANGDKIDSYRIGVNHEVNDGWGVMLGAEFNDYKGAGVAGKAYQRWYDIGVNYSMSDMAKLSVMWQFSDADAKTTGFWAAPGNPTGRFSGNVITTQFTIKF